MSRRSPVTAADVAKLAGVSISAVSRAFTKGASISSRARLKVETAARELGYRPNLIARSLITRRSNLVGVAMGYMPNPFYSEALHLLLEALGRAGFQTLLFSADASQSGDLVLDEILHWRVDALILASINLSSPLAAECRAARVPVVLFNRKTSDANVASVTGDNFGGAGEIAAYLAQTDHRHYAFMAGVESSSTSRDREAGFTQWLEANGAGTPVRVVGQYDPVPAREATRKLLSLHPETDALFCANDHMAFAAIEVARYEFGRTLGRDLSIVGFDDVAMAAWPSFSLSTFSQPVEPMISSVVSTMEKLLDSVDTLPRASIVPGELIVRESSRPLPRT